MIGQHDFDQGGPDAAAPRWTDHGDVMEWYESTCSSPGSGCPHIRRPGRTVRPEALHCRASALASPLRCSSWYLRAMPLSERIAVVLLIRVDPAITAFPVFSFADLVPDSDLEEPGVTMPTLRFSGPVPWGARGSCKCVSGLPLWGFFNRLLQSSEEIVLGPSGIGQTHGSDGCARPVVPR